MNAPAFAKSLLARVARAVESEEDPTTLRADVEALVKQFTASGDLNALQILKADDDKRMAWGWALVSVEKGQMVCDLQGDEVTTEELQQAVHGSFMNNGRKLKRMHSGKPIGEVVDSIVLTKELQKALGIDLGREGWFVGVRIDDAPTWALVKSGKLPAFSIGGAAERHAVDKRVTPALFGALYSAFVVNKEVQRRRPVSFHDLHKTWSDEARAAAAEARRTGGHNHQLEHASQEAHRASVRVAQNPHDKTLNREAARLHNRAYSFAHTEATHPVPGKSLNRAVALRGYHASKLAEHQAIGAERHSKATLSAITTPPPVSKAKDAAGHGSNPRGAGAPVHGQTYPHGAHTDIPRSTHTVLDSHRLTHGTLELRHKSPGMEAAGSAMRYHGHNSYGAIVRANSGTTHGQWYKTREDAQAHFDRVKANNLGFAKSNTPAMFADLIAN